MVATSAITTVPQNQQLASFQPEDIKVKRMVALMKAGIKAPNASESEFVALATLCMAHNLDPYNGEAWIIPGNGVMTGIKGLRKAADAQLPPGSHKIPALRLLQHTEYEAYGITGDVRMAFLCELTRTDATQQWVDQLTQLCKIGMDYEKALATLGPRPVWIGVGIVRPTDKSKMPLDQLGRKRAEADALKRAFNLPFNIDLSHENGEAVPVDGEWEEAPYTELEPAQNAPEPATATETGEAISSQGEGENKPAWPARPWSLEVIGEFFGEMYNGMTEKSRTTAMTPDEHQKLGRALNGIFPDAASRHIFQYMMLGVPSISEFNVAQGKTMRAWARDAASAKREIEDIVASAEFAAASVELAALEAEKPEAA